MRVAHVITRLILGGAQENTILTCHDLLRLHGDEVLLVTGPGIGPEGSLEAEARHRHIPMTVLPAMRRTIHPWRDARSFQGILHALRRFRPDVVHTHSGKAGLLGRLAAARLHVPAIVHTIHGAPFHAYQGRGARALFRWCETLAARRSHALVSVADAMTELMVDAGVAPREKFVTIHSGMEVQPFLEAHRQRDRLRRVLGYKDSDVVVGKVARLFHLKGHSDVVSAAGRLCASNSRLRFLFIGDGVLRESIARQIKQAGLAERFQFTGLVPREQVAGLMAAMDIIVHASLREGLARALPQALIAGKPVISYDVDGAREVVAPGETGFLVAPRDVAALATAIQRLAADAALRHRMGQEGRSRCAEQFRHETTTLRLRELYDQLLARGRYDSLFNGPPAGYA